MNTQIKTLTSLQASMVRSHWVIKDEQLAAQVEVQTLLLPYWNLVDYLVEGCGFVMLNGLRYVPRLLGKTAQGTQVSGSKTGKFFLKFRQYGDLRICLIQEAFLTQRWFATDKEIPTDE